MTPDRPAIDAADDNYQVAKNFSPVPGLTHVFAYPRLSSAIVLLHRKYDLSYLDWTGINWAGSYEYTTLNVSIRPHTLLLVIVLSEEDRGRWVDVDADARQLLRDYRLDHKCWVRYYMALPDAPFDRMPNREAQFEDYQRRRRTAQEDIRAHPARERPEPPRLPPMDQSVNYMGRRGNDEPSNIGAFRLYGDGRDNQAQAPRRVQTEPQARLPPSRRRWEPVDEPRLGYAAAVDVGPLVYSPPPPPRLSQNPPPYSPPQRQSHHGYRPRSPSPFPRDHRHPDPRDIFPPQEPYRRRPGETERFIPRRIPSTMDEYYFPRYLPPSPSTTPSDADGDPHSYHATIEATWGPQWSRANEDLWDTSHYADLQPSRTSAPPPSDEGSVTPIPIPSRVRRGGRELYQPPTDRDLEEFNAIRERIRRTRLEDAGNEDDIYRWVL